MRYSSNFFSSQEVRALMPLSDLQQTWLCPLMHTCMYFKTLTPLSALHQMWLCVRKRKRRKLHRQ